MSSIPLSSSHTLLSATPQYQLEEVHIDNPEENTRPFKPAMQAAEQLDPSISDHSFTLPPGHALGIPFNAIYNRDFSSFKRIFELSKVFFSASAAKVKAGASLQVYLATALGATGTTPLFGVAATAISAYSLKTSLTNLGNSNKTLLEKVSSVAKGSLAAYGLTTGLAILAQYLPASLVPGFLNVGNSFYPSWGVNSLTFIATQLCDWALYAMLGLVALSVVQTILFSGINEIGQGITKVWAGWNEDRKFESIYDELGLISQEEYQEILAKEMGFKSFEELKKAEILNPFIKEGQENSNPENAFRPLLAILIVTRRELKGNEEAQEDIGEMGNYSKLVAENKLQEAQNLLKSVIIPKIFYYTFIRHCILEPTRPDLGIIKHTADGKMVYDSFVAQLTKKQELFPLNAIDMNEIFLEAAKILDAEVHLQKGAYFQALIEHLGKFEQVINNQPQQPAEKLDGIKKV